MPTTRSPITQNSMSRALRAAGHRCALALLLAAAPIAAQADGIVTVGTDDHTGTYYHGGGGICSLVNEGRSEHRMRCRVTSTSGAIDNIDALRRGERALGFAPASLARDAYQGSGVFADRGEFNGLRVVTALNNETVTLVARDGTGVSGVRDLDGARVNLGTDGSSERALMNALMEILGLLPGDFADARSLPAGDQVEAFCAGELDVALFLTSHPNRAVRDTLDCGGSLVPAEGAGINRMVRDHDQYHNAAIPAGAYAGVSDDVATFSVSALLLSSTNTSRDEIYEVTRALFNNLDRFAEWHDAFAGLDATGMIERTRESGTPLHPGAEMYFREEDLW